METNFKTYPETAPFVEALQAVLLAEAKTLTGFSDIYGDTFSKDGGKTGDLPLVGGSPIDPQSGG